jgi:hypothetical protein
LPDEQFGEVIRDYEATFYDISENAIEQPQIVKADSELSGFKDELHKPVMRLRLTDVMRFLKGLGYKLENCLVSYFSSIFSAYVNCNLDPSSQSIFLTEQDLEMIDNKEALRLKISKGPRRQYQDSDDESFLDHSSEQSDSERKDESKHSEDSLSGMPRR